MSLQCLPVDSTGTRTQLIRACTFTRSVRIAYKFVSSDMAYVRPCGEPGDSVRAVS